MNRCPNQKCRQKCDGTRGFCNSCGIAIYFCTNCRLQGKATINRGDGFYCRRCGVPMALPVRTPETHNLFNPHEKIFCGQIPHLRLNERSDSFSLVSSQAKLWLLTSNNNLRIVENYAKGLAIYNEVPGKVDLEQLQTAIKYLEPLTAPIVFHDRVVLFGAKRIFSFSIHPHANRWLQQRCEINLPDQWQPIFNSQATIFNDAFEIPVMLDNRAQSTLLRLTRDIVTGNQPFPTESYTNAIPGLMTGSLDIAGNYYWVKSHLNNTGRIYYLKRRGTKGELVLVNTPPLLYFVRPAMENERLVAITEEHRLIEIVLQKGEVLQQRKLHQVDRGARLLVIARERIVVAVHETICFFDYQTGELLSVATDIDASHIFVDEQGMLMAIHRNGQLIMINSAQPLERWNTEDATTDDSRIYDAFVVDNSLYTLSENGEVCRFDFC